MDSQCEIPNRPDCVCQKTLRVRGEQVGFRDFEPVRRAHHRFEARAGIFVMRAARQNAMDLSAPRPDLPRN